MFKYNFIYLNKIMEHKKYVKKNIISTNEKSTIKDHYLELFQKLFINTINFFEDYKVPKNTIIYLSVGSAIIDAKIDVEDKYFQIYPEFLHNTNIKTVCISIDPFNDMNNEINSFTNYVSKKNNLDNKNISSSKDNTYINFNNMIEFYFIKGSVPLEINSFPYQEIGIPNKEDYIIYYRIISDLINKSKINNSFFIYNNFTIFYNYIQHISPIKYIADLFDKNILDEKKNNKIIRNNIIMNWTGIKKSIDDRITMSEMITSNNILVLLNKKNILNNEKYYEINFLIENTSNKILCNIYFKNNNESKMR